jgi:hypothetical protein
VSIFAGLDINQGMKEGREGGRKEGYQGRKVIKEGRDVIKEGRKEGSPHTHTHEPAV